MMGAKLVRANLTNADLTMVDLRGADLTNADMTGANLTGANLTGANLTGANLTRTNLTGTYLRDAIYDISQFSDKQIVQVNTNGGIDLPVVLQAQARLLVDLIEQEVANNTR
jgi:uncharacterized protein YjbI with pentapeptide repeats